MKFSLKILYCPTQSLYYRHRWTRWLLFCFVYQLAFIVEITGTFSLLLMFCDNYLDLPLTDLSQKLETRDKRELNDRVGTKELAATSTFQWNEFQV